MPEILPHVNMFHQHYWSTMGPIITVSATAFLVMILEFIFREGRRRWLTVISFLGVIAALVVALVHFHPVSVTTLGTMIRDGLGSVFSVLLLITAALVLLFTYDYQGKTKLAAEHTYLILFALAGALAMATSVDLVTLYVGLELLSVASYVLVAVRKQSIRSVEGGIKYLVMGSIGSAVLLYGLSFIYGIAGSTNLFVIARDSGQMWSNYSALAMIGFLLILAGIGVKLSLVPFHMWTPDAYDGAPAPISSFLATLSKTAAFVMLLRILLYTFNGATSHVFYWAAVLSVVTMVVGNLLALPQRNMKRLLAFSSVAQAGYILIPFALFGTSTPSDWTGLYDNITFYLFGYTFMTIGAFAVVHVVSHHNRTIDSDALIGLWRKSPWLAFALTVFLLSLAGMPLTAGFLGKFYIFVSTLHLRTLWLGIALFATSVISFYYYFGWIRKMFQSDLPGSGSDQTTEGSNAGYSTTSSVGAHSAATTGLSIAATPIRVSAVMATLLGLCVVGTLILGIVPAALLHPLDAMQWF